MNLRGLVLDYLHNLQAQGVQRLAVDEEARGILRGWILAARRGVPVAPMPMAAAVVPGAAVAAGAAVPQPQLPLPKMPPSKPLFIAPRAPSAVPMMPVVRPALALPFVA